MIISEEFIRRFRPRVADWFPMRGAETFDEYCGRVRLEHEGKRALIAAEWASVADELAHERQAEKTAWIANARNQFSPGARKNCAVCGKYRFLTHAHHIYPLARQYDDGRRDADQAFVWLCPNHHAVIHVLLLDEALAPEDVAASGVAFFLELGKEEAEKLGSFIAHQARTR